ncbi:MAG: thiol:disulfide interchange protein DsbA/DsbL [Gammaproteobacteria bacterium]|nr:MAG: thiol:disulfide interchange protein DsbA/DsbL [Gammaproteobacteria bacterium]
MGKTASWALIGLLLTACGQGEAPAPATAAPEPATAPPASVPAADAEPLRPPEQLDPAAEPVDGETVEAPAAEVAAPVMSPVAAAVAASTPELPTNAPLRWQEGQHYKGLTVAQPSSAPPGEVEVVEVFWYGCGHCYALEPRLEAWLQDQPAWLHFRRLPVVWNEVTREDARLYYTIEALGKLETLHPEVFRELHARGRPLTVVRNNRVDTAATEQAVREFLVARGVSAEDFARHYRTFSIESRLRQAENLTRRYMADHTPMMVVQGKFVTDVSMAGSQNELMQVVADLAARERDGR